MSRPVHFRKGALLVRVTLDEDFDETPLYAEAVDSATGRFFRDNRLIEQILKGEFSEPITEAEFEVFQGQSKP